MWSHRRSFGLAVAVVCVSAPLALTHETLTTTVLFDREIVRILNKHCVMCHVENGPAFPLESWEQTWLQARKIRADAIARHMPPWPAFPGYGQFINDNSLTLRETQFIVSWVEGSGPRNAGTVFTNTSDPNAARRTEVRAKADFGHWQLGEPQLVRELAPNTIEPDKADVRRVVIDPGLPSARNVRAVEYMPGDRRVVRAAFFTVQETGQWIGSWTPWYGFENLPKGSAWKLPAGSHIVAEIHYQGTKQRITEHGTIGLFFADQAAPKIVSDLILNARGTQRVHAETRLMAGTDALAMRLDFQPGLRSVEVSAKKPDGTKVMMLFAKYFQPDWPTPFIFKDPVPLPKGAELSVIGYYGDTQPGEIGMTMSTVSNETRLKPRAGLSK
jgi:hypothetical protein